MACSDGEVLVSVLCATGPNDGAKCTGATTGLVSEDKLNARRPRAGDAAQSRQMLSDLRPVSPNVDFTMMRRAQTRDIVDYVRSTL